MRDRLSFALVCLAICSLAGCGTKAVPPPPGVAPVMSQEQQNEIAHNINSNPYLTPEAKAKKIDDLKQMMQQRAKHSSASPSAGLPNQ